MTYTERELRYAHAMGGDWRDNIAHARAAIEAANAERWQSAPDVERAIHDALDAAWSNGRVELDEDGHPSMLDLAGIAARAILPPIGGESLRTVEALRDRWYADDENDNYTLGDAAAELDAALSNGGGAVASGPGVAPDTAQGAEPPLRTTTSAPPSPQPEAVEVFRGWVGFNDGNRTDIERWVQAADGDWISLDSTIRTTREPIVVVD